MIVSILASVGRLFRILENQNELMMDIGSVGKWIAVRENPLMPLIEDFQTAEFEFVRQQGLGQIRMEHNESRLVTEVADNDGHVLGPLQGSPTVSKIDATSSNSS